MRLDRRDMLRTLMASLVGLMLSGCWGNEDVWKQKITVTVATPSGDQVESAVTEITRGYQSFMGAGGYSHMQGEAVVLEIQPRKYLFALIHEDQKNLAQTVFQKSLPKDTPQALNAITKMQGEKAMIPGGLYPMLVTFKNISDPRSVIEVKPYDRDFAEAFGPGVRLKSITLEITDEPVTEGVVERVLPWVWDATERYVPASIRQAKKGDPLNSVGGGDFITPFRRPEKTK